jgi:hypothetical protein
MKKIRFGRPHKKSHKVFVIMPVPLNYAVNLETSTFLARAVARGIADWEALPSRAAEDGRNRMLRTWLASRPEYTHGLLLDADTWPYDDFAIERLLSHRKDVVAGVTAVQRSGKQETRYQFDRAGSIQAKGGDGLPPRPKKMWNVQTQNSKGKYVNIHRDLDDPTRDELPKGLFEAARVGGTTMLIRRKVIMEMDEPFMFTQRDERGDVSLGEDYVFCDKLRALGNKIWVDPTVKCGHMQSVDIGRY